MRRIHKHFHFLCFFLHLVLSYSLQGYPTVQHRQALWEHGPCAIHRFSYSPVKIAKERFEKLAKDRDEEKLPEEVRRKCRKEEEDESTPLPLVARGERKRKKEFDSPRIPCVEKSIFSETPEDATKRRSIRKKL